MDQKASALNRAEDQQLMGAYLHSSVSRTIDMLPRVKSDDVVQLLKADQVRRALHYKRARVLMGIEPVTA